MAERGAELAAKQQQRAAAEAERASLEARVAAQTFSKEDVQRMTADKCGLSTSPALPCGCLSWRCFPAKLPFCCWLAKGVVGSIMLR